MQSKHGTSTFTDLCGLKGRYSHEKMNLWQWTPLHKLYNSWAASFLCHKKAFESVCKNKFQISFHFHPNGRFFTLRQQIPWPLQSSRKLVLKSKMQNAIYGLAAKKKQKILGSRLFQVGGFFQHVNSTSFFYFCLLVHLHALFSHYRQEKNQWFSYLV